MGNKKHRFNANPPLGDSGSGYVVLKEKAGKNCFWTSGGEYRCDIYEVAFRSDILDEAVDFYMKMRYDSLHKGNPSP